MPQLSPDPPFPDVDDYDFPQAENEKAKRVYMAGQYSRDGNHFVRHHQVPWGHDPAQPDVPDHEDVVKSFLGYSTVVEGVLKRFLPFKDFQHRNAYATRVDVEPEGYRGGDTIVGQPLTSGNKYKWANLTVTYQTLPYPVGTVVNVNAVQGDDDFMLGEAVGNETERFCFKDIRPGKEMYGRKMGGYVYADNTSGHSVNFSVPIIASLDDIIVTWYGIPRDAYPKTAILACRDKVCDATLVTPNFPDGTDYDAETIMLQSFSVRQTFFPDGLPACDVSYNFKRRAYPILDSDGDVTGYGGWNHVVTQSGRVKRIYRKRLDGDYSTADKQVGPYLKADFSKLFKPEGS